MSEEYYTIEQQIKDNGLWFNDRLEIEKNKRKSFIDSRINNKKGVNQYSKKRGHKTSDMENENKDINILVLREEIFNKEVENFKNYPASMLKEFINYWTEPNKSCTKMRFELEKTWDLKRRLERWALNAALKAPVSKKQPEEKRTGGTYTQKQLLEYKKEHGKFPGQ